MTHLTEAQFVDVLEGRIPVERGLATHLAACEACGAALAELTEGLADARAVVIPEPSPLFWEHFSRRVRAATSQETPPAALGRTWRTLWQPLLGVTLAAGTLAVLFLVHPGRLAHEAIAPTTAPPVATVATAGPAATGDLDDAGLNVVAVLAEDLRTEDLQQVARPTADATAAAIEDLTPAQCAELMRLMKAQMSGAE